MADEAARELQSRARAARKTAAANPAEGAKYAHMEPLSQVDKGGLGGLDRDTKKLSPAKRQERKGVLKTQR